LCGAVEEHGDGRFRPVRKLSGRNDHGHARRIVNGQPVQVAPHDKHSDYGPKPKGSIRSIRSIHADGVRQPARIQHPAGASP
jgi:hypothetical protein